MTDLPAGAYERIKCFAKDCVHRSSAEGLHAPETLAALAIALSCVAAEAVIPGCEAEMLDRIIDNLQESYASALRTRGGL